MKHLIRNKKENYPKVGEWKSEMPIITDKCVGCETCVKHCPEAAMFMGEVQTKKKSTTGQEEVIIKRRAGVRYELCKGCGICAEVCPVKAIKMVKKIG